MRTLLSAILLFVRARHNGAGAGLPRGTVCLDDADCIAHWATARSVPGVGALLVWHHPVSSSTHVGRQEPGRRADCASRRARCSAGWTRWQQQGEQTSLAVLMEYETTQNILKCICGALLLQATFFEQQNGSEWFCISQTRKKQQASNLPIKSACDWLKAACVDLATSVRSQHRTPVFPSSFTGWMRFDQALFCS